MPDPKPGEYKCVSSHPEDLVSGRVLGVGETVTLEEADVSEPHNRRLIEDGLLIRTDADQQQLEPPPPPPGPSGDAKNDEGKDGGK